MNWATSPHTLIVVCAARFVGRVPSRRLRRLAAQRGHGRSLLSAVYDGESEDSNRCSDVSSPAPAEVVILWAARIWLRERDGIMVPSDFSNYFLASTGAGAALVGLLFVAISVGPERIFGRNALAERQVVAASAFSALVNAFVVSLAALIPGMNVGGVAIVMGVLALSSTVQQMRRLWDGHMGMLHLARRMSLPVSSFVIYGLEITSGISLIQHGVTVGPLFSLSVLLLVIYGVGLTRAWQLLGAPRSGIFSWLLDPFLNVHESKEVRPTEAGAKLKPDADGRLPEGAPAGTQRRRDADKPGA